MFWFCSTDIVPKSYNSARLKKAGKAHYFERIQAAFSNQNPDFKTDSNSELYIQVFFFSPNDRNLPDADNISKPICDALANVAYSDDKQLVMRTAAVVSLNEREISLDTIPDTISDLMEKEVIQNQKPLLYVYIGKFQFDMIQFSEI
jgi:Holliday junction resolvase RusA-like endonuclease